MKGEQGEGDLHFFKKYKKEIEDLQERFEFLNIRLRQKEKEINTDQRFIDLWKNLSAVRKDAIRLKDADDDNKVKLTKLKQSWNFLKDDKNYFK